MWVKGLCALFAGERPAEDPRLSGVVGLSESDVAAFERDGFVCLRGAFSPETAAAGVEILYEAIRSEHPLFDPADASTYPGPKFLHLGSDAPPFATAASSATVAAACNALVGEGRWTPRTGLGTFPIRFPHPESAQDDGWHIDVSIPRPDGDWWVNVATRNRALLSLWLFTDVTEEDAPTRIRVGSHRRMAAALAPFGRAGVSGFDTARLVDVEDLPVVTATGRPGDVFLCHPFLIHAAGSHPASIRILAQPDIAHDSGCGTWRPDGAYSAVERSIRDGITDAGIDVPSIAPQPRST